MSWTIQEITDRCIETCGKVDINFDIPVKINGRLTRTLGRLMYKPGYELIPDRIEISRQLLETASDGTIVSVIDHECAHYIVAIETGEQHGHDSVFRNACARIGCRNDKPSTAVERIVSDDKIYKYQVICDDCGYSLGYSRAGKIVKYVNWYKCGKCGGELHVQQNW